MLRFLIPILAFTFCSVFAGEPSRPAISDGYYAFIDTAGQVVLKTSLRYNSNFPLFYSPRQYSFNERRAIVRYENGYGIIDRFGNVIFNSDDAAVNTSPDGSAALHRCTWIASFSEGLAASFWERKFLGISYDGHYGFIDSTGKLVIPPQFDAAGPFSEGLAPVKKDGAYGFIDRQGVVRIPFQYEQAKPFSGGLALVKKDGNFRYIDHNNQTVIEAAHPFPHPFKEGLSLVREGDIFGYMDTSGTLIIPAQFEIAGDFSEGLALVQQHGRFGFIDRRGRWAIAPRFIGAASFREGLAAVKTDSLWGYIDRQGNIVIDPQFDRVWNFMNGLAVAWQGNSIFYINTSGEPVYILFEGPLVSTASEKEEARIQYLLSH